MQVPLVEFTNTNSSYRGVHPCTAARTISKDGDMSSILSAANEAKRYARIHAVVPRAHPGDRIRPGVLMSTKSREQTSTTHAVSKKQKAKDKRAAIAEVCIGIWAVWISLSRYSSLSSLTLARSLALARAVLLALSLSLLHALARSLARSPL